MNRKSFTGPLILIVIGVLFLLRNVWPDLAVMSTLAVWWPAVLIAWGLIRLIEVAMASREPGQPRVAGFGGGEVVLVVFICLAGSALFAVNRRGPWRFESRGLEIFGETHEYDVAGQKAVPANARLVFENPRGNLRITAGEAAELKVTGRRSIRAYTHSEADKANQQATFEILAEGDRFIVRTNHDRARGVDRMSTDLEVAAPKGASIEVRGQSGDFEATGIQGSVNVNGSRGAVRLAKIGGNARVEMSRADSIRASEVKGDVSIDSGRCQDLEVESVSGQVTVTGSYSGSLEFRNLAKPLHFESKQTDLKVEALPGHLMLDLGHLTAANIVGPVRLSTRSRDVRFEDFSNSLEVTLDRGDIELHPGKKGMGKIDARSRAGNIEITLPESGGFDLKGASERGEVSNEFGSALKVETEGRGSTVKGAVGKGPAVNLNTERGAITVRKG